VIRKKVTPMIPADIPPDVMIPATVGTILSLIVSLIVQVSWPSWIKGIVVVASSLIAGFATALIRGDLSGIGWLQSIGIVWSFAVFAYNFFWKPTGIGPKLEAMTTLKRLIPTPTTKK
jgi:hypothetical protein